MMSLLNNSKIGYVDGIFPIELEIKEYHRYS
jgi:hypothetical protein